VTFFGRSRLVAVVSSGALAFGLGGCDNIAPLELRCAAFFQQLSGVKIGDVPPSRSAAYRQHALAFIDRLPGDRAENVAAMHKVGDSIMADDGLREQCDRLMPLREESLEAA
jgi:hypothetical protein